AHAQGGCTPEAGERIPHDRRYRRSCGRHAGSAGSRSSIRAGRDWQAGAGVEGAGRDDRGCFEVRVAATESATWRRSIAPQKSQSLRSVMSLVPVRPATGDFDEVIRLIEAARRRAFAAVNKELIDLYWQVGEYISRKLASSAWGEGVVQQLADHIARQHPDL